MSELNDLLDEWASTSPYSTGTKRTPEEDTTSVGDVTISSSPNSRSRIITGEGKKEEKSPAPGPTGPTTQQTAPMDTGPRIRPSSIEPPTTNLDMTASTTIFKNIEDKVLLANKTGDINESARIMAEVKGDIESIQGKFYKEARNQAYAEFNVAGIAKELEQNEKMDRSHPQWAQNLSDSSETAAVRDRFVKMKLAADGSIPEMLKSNDTYRSLNAKLETLAAAGSAAFGRKNSILASAEERASLLYDSLGTEGQKRISMIMPEESKNPMMVAAMVKNSPELIATLQAKEEDLPRIALRGNRTALDYLIKDESNVIGSKAKVLLEEGFSIAQDPERAKSALKTLSDSGLLSEWKAEDKAAAEAAVGVLGNSGTKEDRDRNHEERIRIATAYMKFKHKKEFNSDMMKLASDSNTPDFLKVASQDPTRNKGIISKSEAISLAVSAPTNIERQTNSQQLYDFYKSAVEKTNDSKQFAISINEAEQLRAQLSVSNIGWLFGKVSDSINSVTNGLISGMETLAPIVPSASMGGVDPRLIGYLSAPKNGGIK